jgi:hypothetical protein
MGTTSLFRGYSFAPHRNIDFAIHLCEGLGYCTLCKFLGRPRSNYDYIHCPVCAKEREEYAHNQCLQDFLFELKCQKNGEHALSKITLKLGYLIQRLAQAQSPKMRN